VLLEDPVYPGVWVQARPLGVLYMHDEAGEDAKIICVPPREPRWGRICRCRTTTTTGTAWASPKPITRTAAAIV
jgi:inorganic pyrophosphatase